MRKGSFFQVRQERRVASCCGLRDRLPAGLLSPHRAMSGDARRLQECRRGHPIALMGTAGLSEAGGNDARRRGSRRQCRYGRRRDFRHVRGCGTGLGLFQKSEPCPPLSLAFGEGRGRDVSAAGLPSPATAFAAPSAKRSSSPRPGVMSAARRTSAPCSSSTSA